MSDILSLCNVDVDRLELLLLGITRHTRFPVLGQKTTYDLRIIKNFSR